MSPLSSDQLEAFENDGYAVVRGLWTREEMDRTRDFFQHLATEADLSDWPTHNFSPDRGNPEPLKAFPRVLHPHRFHGGSRDMLLDPRIEAVLLDLLGEPAVAAQSMLYFKPPGGKGQALHQDNLYLRVHPQTCIAAWTAIDPAGPDNGGLWVVPGTQGLDVQCPELADPEESFTTHYVKPPNGATPVPVELDSGDVLFFNGSVVHGSRPNATEDKWRRSFICHYAPASADSIFEWYHPCFRFDGTEHPIGLSPEGAPCGTEFPERFPADSFEDSLAAGLVPARGGSIPA